MSVRDLLALLGTLATVQAVVVAAAILGRRSGQERERHPAVAALAAALLAGGLTLGAILLSHRLGSDPLLWAVEAVGTAVSGPLVYGWVARVLEETRRARWRRHLALPALLGGYEAISVAVWWTAGRIAAQPPVGALLLLQAGYTVAAAALLARRWREPEAAGRRGWVAGILALLAVVHLASAARWARVGEPLNRDVVPAAGVLLVYAVTFLALRQPRLLRLVDDPAPGPPAPSPPIDDDGSPRRKYETSPLRPEQVVTLRARALDHLTLGRAFLRPELTLSQLAQEIDTLPTHLSRVINEGGEGFPELVARLRVEEAARLLADPAYDHLTVEALGRRAGFPSRSAFYEAFRRLRGTTPSAHRRERGARDRPDS